MSLHLAVYRKNAPINFLPLEGSLLYLVQVFTAKRKCRMYNDFWFWPIFSRSSAYDFDKNGTIKACLHHNFPSTGWILLILGTYTTHLLCSWLCHIGQWNHVHIVTSLPLEESFAYAIRHHWATMTQCAHQFAMVWSHYVWQGQLQHDIAYFTMVAKVELNQNLSHRELDKRTAICRPPFECISIHENILILIKVSLKFICKGLINNMPPLVKIMTQCPTGDKSLFEEVYWCIYASPGSIFCLLLGVSSDYAQPITGQVTEVACPVIGRAQPELTQSKRQKTGHGLSELNLKPHSHRHTMECLLRVYWSKLPPL